MLSAPSRPAPPAATLSSPGQNWKKLETVWQKGGEGHKNREKTPEKRKKHAKKRKKYAENAKKSAEGAPKMRKKALKVRRKCEKSAGMCEKRRKPSNGRA